MKVALTIWEDTVSTVCDFASRILVLDVIGNEVKSRSSVPFETGTIPERVNQLGALEVEVLLCGAISGPLERRILASGVKVIPCLRGPIEEVIGAYLDGHLLEPRFTLPGFGPKAEFKQMGRRQRGGFCRLSGMAKQWEGPGSIRASIQTTDQRERKIKMKIAITATGENLNSAVDRVFGRARYFVIMDAEGNNVEVLENSQNVNAAQGAGIQTAQHIADRSVNVLLTGNVGPNAFRALEAASVRVFQFERDILTVRDALAAWKEGRLQEVKAPTAKGHGF